MFRSPLEAAAFDARAQTEQDTEGKKKRPFLATFRWEFQRWKFMQNHGDGSETATRSLGHRSRPSAYHE